MCELFSSGAPIAFLQQVLMDQKQLELSASLSHENRQNGTHVQVEAVHRREGGQKAADFQNDSEVLGDNGRTSYDSVIHSCNAALHAFELSTGLGFADSSTDEYVHFQRHSGTKYERAGSFTASVISPTAVTESFPISSMVHSTSLDSPVNKFPAEVIRVLQHQSPSSSISSVFQEGVPFHSSRPSLMTDAKQIIFLLMLYTIQGVPMGLSASIPFLLQGRVSYKQLGLFSLVSVPFR